MPKQAKPKSMTEVLRQTIIDSKMPLLTLSNATGVARASLIRFVRDETSLRLDLADKLAAYFGLELRRRTPTKG